MKNEPCPKCGGEPVQKDCGYTTFNPVWVECTICGLKSQGAMDSWNKWVKATRAKTNPAKCKRRWSDALARMMTEQELLNLLCGKSADGERNTRGF